MRNKNNQIPDKYKLSPAQRRAIARNAGLKVPTRLRKKRKMLRNAFGTGEEVCDELCTCCCGEAPPADPCSDIPGYDGGSDGPGGILSLQNDVIISSSTCDAGVCGTVPSIPPALPGAGGPSSWDGTYPSSAFGSLTGDFFWDNPSGSNCYVGTQEPCCVPSMGDIEVAVGCGCGCCFAGFLPFGVSEPCEVDDGDTTWCIMIDTYGFFTGTGPAVSGIFAGGTCVTTDELTVTAAGNFVGGPFTVTMYDSLAATITTCAFDVTFQGDP